MALYPPSLQTATTTTQREPKEQLQLNQQHLHQPHALETLAEDSSSNTHGIHTPSHGGVVNSGHEYDMYISPSIPPGAPSSPPVANSARPNAAQLAARQRPLSMPAQQQSSLNQLRPSPVPSGDINGDKREPSTPGHESNNKPAPETNPSAAGRGTATRNRVLGDYTLSKTLGAGSMGKVKLAHHNVTGEKFAVKIVPRLVPNLRDRNTETQKQALKDASKEVRTIREASLSLLFYHPYICGMRELITHQHHYYMVFEYVNGGQMLDYIIAHGRLRERVARKFARQIGSALDYLHQNNIVHRDLKIENILISESGNIKIIDFGLSNLFSPSSSLATFCGSLYFAAPELLNAKVYTGPEVDVWSFGVVLYVLVCGKVPFDDQSMPALHAKIKRGLVEYPVWLSAECKHLLTRMLVTQPQNRASLPEVLAHQWMTRGFDARVENFLVQGREPLVEDSLDNEVIHGMGGFEFGTTEQIENRLKDIISSERYRKCVRIWEAIRDGRNPESLGVPVNGHGPSSFNYNSSSSVAISSLASSSNNSLNSPSATPNHHHASKKKRFSAFGTIGAGFDRYRKFFTGSSSPTSSAIINGSSYSSHTNSHPRNSAGIYPQDPWHMEYIDPTRGFHPLLSMYYLVREKKERERLYGRKGWAGSAESLTIASPNFPKEGESVVPAPISKDKNDHPLPIPQLPPPATAHTGGLSSATPTPTTPNSFSQQQQQQAQPRGRERDVPLTSVIDAPPDVTSPPPVVKVPPIASGHGQGHRRSQSLTTKSWSPGGRERKLSGLGPIIRDMTKKPSDAVPKVPTKENSKEAISMTATPPPPTSPTLIRRFGTLFGDGGSHKNRRLSLFAGGKDGVDEHGNLPDARAETDVENAKSKAEGRKIHIVESERERGEKTGGALTHSASQPLSATHRRATTMLDPASRQRGAHGGHERRSSAIVSFGVGRSSTVKRPSTATDSQFAQNRFRPVGEDIDREKHEGEDSNRETVSTDKEDDGFKPIYMKGLFSVATTTSKPASVLKKDIHRVLERMQVQYRPTKAGFECLHLPSIDVSSIPVAGTSSDGVNGHRYGPVATLRKKTSKLSFKKRRDGDTASENKDPNHPAFPPPPSPSPRPPSVKPSMNRTNSSFFSLNSGTQNAILHPENIGVEPNERTPQNLAKGLPELPRSPNPFITGEVTDEVFEATGANERSVRFEVNIVKVPLLPLHGIHFRRIGGDGWQYQMLARRVLTELKL